MNINLMDPALIKEFLQEKYLLFQKSQFFIDSFFSIIGIGLPFAEGEDWKKGKKILGKCFQFDNIKKSVERISAIVDAQFSKIDVSGEVVVKNYLEQITAGVSVEVFLGPMSKDYKIWDKSIAEALIDFAKLMQKGIGSGILGYLFFGK